MNNIFVAFSIVGAAAVAPAMAVAAPYTVHGSVLDAMTAETLPGASCAFYAANDTVKPLLTLMTGADGSFTADLPRPGEYLMKVTLVSQKPVSRSLVLTDENPVVDLGTIAMQPEGEALEEVVITGRRPVIEATGDKVAYNLTEDPNTQTHTVLEMLRKVPMVTVDAQDNIYINGQSNFKIYLNGKEDPMLGQNASTILKSLPATSIKRIEVILDPGAKYDAEGVGGILNIITETQASTDGQMATITVGGGANNAQASVYGMAKKNKVTASVDVSYYKRFGYREDKGGIERETFDVPSPTVTRQEIAQRQNNHFVNGNARLSWEPNDKNLFTISASGYGGGGKNHYRTTTDVFGDNGLRLSHSRQKLASKWIWSSITVKPAISTTLTTRVRTSCSATSMWEVGTRTRTAPPPWSRVSTTSCPTPTTTPTRPPTSTPCSLTTPSPSASTSPSRPEPKESSAATPPTVTPRSATPGAT